jgi:hypothetical protein
VSNKEYLVKINTDEKEEIKICNVNELCFEMKELKEKYRSQFNVQVEVYKIKLKYQFNE